jgi:hypothetical protein
MSPGMSAVHASNPEAAGATGQQQQQQQTLFTRGLAAQGTPRMLLARLPPKTPKNLLDELMEDELVSLDGLA